MNYSNFQKILSSLILIIFFFGQITGLSIFSIFSNVYAQNRDFSNIVSIIVDQKSYNKLESKIERYAKDIQSSLENTRAIILPLEENTSSFSIASLNESLYNQGYKSLDNVDFESRLIGTVLVGNIPLATIGDNGNISKSIGPFVDFYDKKFIYDHDSKIFEKNNDNIDGFKADIWHGVISPNTGDQNLDIEKISDFFDKTHDFYSGKNNFDSSKNVLNGKVGESLPEDYKPHVFYFDGIREQKSLNYSSYKGYQAYLDNIEDINYNRYSRDLAIKVRDEVLGAQKSELENIIGKIDSDEIETAFSGHLNGPDLVRTSDIMSKQLIDGATNNFIEIFNGGTISDFRTNVHNSGRYNEGTSVVNSDLVPYFVSVLDLVSSKVIKSANTDLENEIDNLVKKSLSRKIAIPEKLVQNNYYSNSGYPNTFYSCATEHINFFNGRQASQINSAVDCSIHRGSVYNSGTLVEANRGLNIGLMQGDVSLCLGNDPKGYYGGSSPINLNKDDLSNAYFNLDSYNTNLAIRNTFDILGSKRVFDNSKTPSPLNCLNKNFLTSSQRVSNGNNSCNLVYQIPLNGKSSVGWSCGTNNKTFNYSGDFISDYKGTKPGGCWAGDKIEYKDSKIVHTKYLNSSINGCQPRIYKTIPYKFIPSFIEHKSPGFLDVNNQITSRITPNLPIDRDRYIDFISAKGNYKKIEYPYLFRVSGNSENDVKLELDKYLDQKSDLINGIISSENPSSLSGKDLEIYNILKNGDYDTNNIDLSSFLKDKPSQNINDNGDSKNVSYYDFLVFSIYWNNLNNISAKYKFILENYLSDHFSNTSFDYILAKNKKNYEIAYLGGHGDSQNMYIKLDPNDKIEGPYSDILSKNSLLNSAKISIGTLNSTNKIGEDGMFKCAPPDGVPIWEWFPAIKCWISNMLPPQVSIGEGTCGSSEIFESEDDYFKLIDEKKICKNDSNKNGINDCSEQKLEDNATLSLSSNNSRYFFNKRGELKTEISDKDGNRILLDDSSYVSYSIKKIVDKDSNEVVYDSSKDDFLENIDLINEYVFFNPISLRSSYGSTFYSFTTKSKEADIYFQASLDLKDYEGNNIVNVDSKELLVKIRNERLFLESNSFDSSGSKSFSKNVSASSSTNVYIFDPNSTDLDVDSLNNDSLVFSLFNVGDNDVRTNINFPLEISLKDSKGNLIQKQTLDNLSGVFELYKIKKSGSYSIEISDRFSYNVSSKFTVLAKTPNSLKIDLGTSVLESGGSVSTNLVSIYDEFDNIVTGDIYEFDFSILGNSLLFQENDSKNLRQNTFEGFKAFRLKPDSQAGVSQLRVDLFQDGKKIMTANKTINVVDTPKIKTKFSDNLKVGNNKYFVDIDILDKNSKLLSELNSRVYVSVDSNYIDLENNYTDIVDGKARIYFSTKIKSKKDLAFKFRVEGFNTDLYSFQTILPGEPMNLELINSDSKLKASSDTQSYINVELRDIYNNIVFTDSNSVVNLDIIDRYKNIISTDTYRQSLNNGITSFKFNATDFPGTAYLKFSTDTDLESNEFSVGQGDNIIKINGISENATKVETFFLYSKDSIENNNYNAIYTTLLGASYGDITQKDYLAGSMLFDKNNRSLAVTSLLNNPYNIKYSLSFSPDGKISKIYDQSDLTQDLSIKLSKNPNNVYYLDVFNRALNINVGKIYLNFENLSITDDVYKNIEESNIIDLQKLFSLNEFEIFNAGNEPILNNLLNTKKDSIIIYLETDFYGLADINSGDFNTHKGIYYNDPFSTNDSLNSFSRYNLDSYDNFVKNGDLGWRGGNKTLLSFSAGNSVGDSSKDYMGINTINLGDPVVSLKKISQNSHGILKRFDKTIGKKLNTNEITTYNVFDYNGDSREDILLIEKSGFLSLLENKNIQGSFLDQRNLARIVDLGNPNLVSSGDFSGDSYDDIFFVNSKGNPFILDNNKKDFVRIDLSDNFDLKGAITDAKSFDMNNDGITDIVTLDTYGEVNIFYGKKSDINFDKKTIYSGYGIKFSGNSRSDMGLVYFRGLTQNVDKNTSLISDSKDTINTDLLENLMFKKIPYDPDIDLENENPTINTSFIKSEFSSQYDIKVEKAFVDKNGGNLQEGDIIDVTLTIKNTSNSKVIRDIVYLEDVINFFNIDTSTIKTEDNILIKSGIGNYKFMIDKFTLNPKSEIKINYSLVTKALSYSYLKVGLFEYEEAGDDKYGDIIISASKYNCGGNSDIFRSISKDDYQKGIKYEKCDKSSLPSGLENNDIDLNSNGIPDYIDDFSDISSSQNSFLKKHSNDYLSAHNNSSNIDSDDNIFDSLDKINETVDKISSGIDNLIQGFGCGFGGGGCYGLPVNWAPLAPGNDPVVLGQLVGDGLKVDEGIPVFSALTGLQTTCGTSPCCLPSVWPVSIKTYIPGPVCGPNGAGGAIGANSPTNFFRLYVTPTLTGGVGVASCFGAPASVVGNTPPAGSNPVVPGGNCVVLAAPLPNLCSDEETNSDPGSIGVVDYSSGVGIINGNCSAGSIAHKKLPISNKIDTSLSSAYLEFRNTGVVSDNLKDAFKNAFKNPAKPGITPNYSVNEPLISVNNGYGDESDISISFDLDGGVEFKQVEEFIQDRVAGFPSFITSWVNDQLEEFITKLTDFPTLFVILPDFSSIYNADWSGYVDDLKSGILKSYDTGVENDTGFFSKQTSGIKEAYEFLGSVPFVSLEGTPVNINIPWIDKATWDATVTQRKLSLEAYQREIDFAKDRWSYGASCEQKSGDEKEECLENNRASERAILDSNKLVASLQANINVLETYKNMPEDLSGLAEKKQDYLEQILCNVDSIQQITVGWLDRNGKRFKSWVELYILIKSILKSWQLLADLFIDYDAECHECKNERHNSVGSQFEIVSMIQPKIPIIQFPKWPDIVLDLHNIRMNLNISLPEFTFNKRPIILPPAPDLKLPDSPGAGLRLPDIPLLPNIETPELPDLSSLPTINLPDLPPPPKLPKLFASIEGVLNILKLVTKAMCILKKSPFVPESRAGDQIAFLTESSGYRSFDFIDLIMPQYSYPFVDEIKIQSFVNLEFEFEFLVEMAKTVAQPINETSSNFYHMFGKPVIDDVDFSNSVDNSDYNIDLSKDNKTGFIDSSEFLSIFNTQLSNIDIIKKPEFREFSKAFDVANNYTYSKENEIISDLQKANLEKFDLLKSIIKKEIKEASKLKKEIKKLETKSDYITISDNFTDDVEVYNASLKKYNDAFQRKAISLVNPNYLDTETLKKNGEYLLNDFKNNTNHIYKDDKYVYNNSFSDNFNSTLNDNYFAFGKTNNNSSFNSCKSKNSNYQRKYEGIYIIQEQGSKKINYKLFDYLDDLDGNETTTSIDFDLDSDIDLLYSMDGNLYLKENLIQSLDDRIYYSNVITLDSDDNKFLNENLFYESPNNFYETIVSNESINLNFSASRKNEILNYRLEYYDIIDKYLNDKNYDYIPIDTKSNIVDGFADSENSTIFYNSGGIIKRNNLAYIDGIGNNISKVRLKTKKLLNIKDSIKSLNIANISLGTKIYAGNESVKITYLTDGDNSPNTFKIDKNTNIEFDKSIEIIGVSGDVYFLSNEDLVLNGTEIYSYLGKPLSFDSIIEIYENFSSNTSSNISIKYYDFSEALIDFRYTKSYTLYDLGLKTDNYSINLDVDNNYFYANLSSFKNNLFSQKTYQILLSPQSYSDKYSPELSLNYKIRVPIYIEKLIDLTEYIYEDSGIDSIENVIIEGIDESQYEVIKNQNNIRIKFNKFDTIFSKKIKFVIEDKNGNIGYNNVDFEVYTPIPEISNYENGVISGFIDENLTGEPINIYRYRGGVIKKLETSSGSTKVNTKTGEFSFDIDPNSSNLVDISVGDSLAFNVLENTGKIILNNPLYRITIQLSDDNFITFNVLDVERKTVFSQQLKLKFEDNDIYIVDKFKNASDNGIYFKLVSNEFDYYKLPDLVNYNPGSLVIYRKSDIDKLPLFAIMKDARIKILNPNFYKLDYSSYEDYIVVKLIDKHFNKLIGKLLFKVDSSYIVN